MFQLIKLGSPPSYPLTNLSTSLRSSAYVYWSSLVSFSVGSNRNMKRNGIKGVKIAINLSQIYLSSSPLKLIFSLVTLIKKRLIRMPMIARSTNRLRTMKVTDSEYIVDSIPGGTSLDTITSEMKKVKPISKF